MRRHQRLIFLVPLFVLALMTMLPHLSHAQTSGTGWLRRDFSLGESVGSYTIFDFERLLVREGVQSVQINQTVRVGTGSSTGTIILMANLHASNVDCGSGAAMWQTPIPPGQIAVYINAGAYQGIIAQSSSAHWYQSTNDNNNTAFMRLTMSRKDSCKMPCPPGIDSAFWYWTVGRYTVGGLESPYPAWPVGVTFTGAYPNYVIHARHGIYSSDVSPLNDVHVDYLFNGYYRPLLCGVNTACPTGHYWGPYEATRWGSLTCEEETLPAKLMVFDRYVDPAADLRGICLGAVYNTPCGCFACEDKIYSYCENDECGNSSGYLRWKKKELFPIRWYLDYSSFASDDPDDWVDAFENGQEFWNDALDSPVFCRTINLSEADVVIDARTPAGATPVKAFTYLLAVDPVYFYDYHCPDPELSGHRVRFVSQQGITVHLQIHYRWVNDSIETESGADPNDDQGEHSRSYVAAHEMGHALMLTHEGNLPDEPVAAPGVTDWNVVGDSYMSDSNPPFYFDSPISWGVTSEQVSAIECALYRRYP